MPHPVKDLSIVTVNGAQSESRDRVPTQPVHSPPQSPTLQLSPLLPSWSPTWSRGEDRFMFSFRYTEQPAPIDQKKFTEDLLRELKELDITVVKPMLRVHNVQKLKYNQKDLVCSSSVFVVEVIGVQTEVEKVKDVVQKKIDSNVGFNIEGSSASMVHEKNFQSLQDAAGNVFRMSSAAKSRKELDNVTATVHMLAKEVDKYKGILESKKKEAINNVEKKFLESFEKKEHLEDKENFGWKKVEEQRSLSDATIKMLVEDMKEFKKTEERRKGTIDQLLQDRREWAEKIDALTREKDNLEKEKKEMLQRANQTPPSQEAPQPSLPLPGRGCWNPGVRVVVSEKETPFEVRRAARGTLIQEVEGKVEVLLDSKPEEPELYFKNEVQLMADFLEIRASQVEKNLMKELFLAQQDVFKPYGFPELWAPQSFLLRMCCLPLPHMEALLPEKPLQDLGCLADCALTGCCCCFMDGYIDQHTKCLNDNRGKQFVRTVRPQGPPEKAEFSCVFKPGKIGVKADWTTGDVISVMKHGAADKNGVKAGMRFAKVGSEKYFEHVLNAAMEGSSEYQVTFEMDVYLSSASFNSVIEELNMMA